MKSESNIRTHIQEVTVIETLGTFNILKMSSRACLEGLSYGSFHISVAAGVRFEQDMEWTQFALFSVGVLVGVTGEKRQKKRTLE